MMSDYSQILLPASVVLLLTLGTGLLRALRGPTLADRMLAVQLLGTGGVGLLLLLSALLRHRLCWTLRWYWPCWRR